jgi:hypothetical protein
MHAAMLLLPAMHCLLLLRSPLTATRTISMYKRTTVAASSAAAQC